MTAREAQIVVRSVMAAVRVFVGDAISRVREEVRKENERALAAIDEINERIAAIPAGPQGPPGRDGIDGKDGERGEIGPTGERGLPGEAGPPGPQGERGVGLVGEQGPPGERGEPGPQGEAGPAGLKGDTGERGLPGEKGDSGPQGERGERGESGIAGPQGERGLDGAPGLNGESVHPDTVRVMIAEEVTRAVDAVKPSNGRDGKDALQIEILPSLDSARSYPRGTFAQHDGGLLYAFRDTEPVTAGIEKAGWTAVLNGIAGEELVQADDMRSFELFRRYTNGKIERFKVATPVVTYEQIYQSGRTYARGQMVTWAGSVWYCRAESTNEKPGEGSPDWVLAVKKGTDLREVKR